MTKQESFCAFMIRYNGIIRYNHELLKVQCNMSFWAWSWSSQAFNVLNVSFQCFHNVFVWFPNSIYSPFMPIYPSTAAAVTMTTKSIYWFNYVCCAFKQYFIVKFITDVFLLIATFVLEKTCNFISEFSTTFTRKKNLWRWSRRILQWFISHVFR